jgi:hypothetical protein
MEARWRSRKLEEFGGTAMSVYTRKRTTQVYARRGGWRHRDFVGGRASHILAVIMLYERLRREEFLRDYCQWEP